jgi:GNAT superfamily N-acetyltransferase
MEILHVAPNELEEIRRIALRTWPVTFKDILSPAQIDYMLEWMYNLETLENQVKNGHSFFLCRILNEPVGFIGLEPDYPTIKTVKLHKIYVLPDFHGKGVGNALLKKGIEFAKSHDANAILLHVNRFNKAVDFYLKNGFTIEKEENIAIGEGFWMEDYVMRLTL